MYTWRSLVKGRRMHDDEIQMCNCYVNLKANQVASYYDRTSFEGYANCALIDSIDEWM